MRFLPCDIAADHERGHLRVPDRAGVAADRGAMRFEDRALPQIPVDVEPDAVPLLRVTGGDAQRALLTAAADQHGEWPL